MVLGSVPTRVRIRWVRVGMLVHPLRGRGKRAVAQVWRGARWPRHKPDGRSIARLAFVQDSVSERRRERELQVLLNLILNACDAMDANPPGMRRLAVATVGGGNAQASLTVTDNGSGIAPGLLERIFDSFFTTKTRGLGVGLSVSREIVAAHGGRIEAANRAEGG